MKQRSITWGKARKKLGLQLLICLAMYCMVLHLLLRLFFGRFLVWSCRTLFNRALVQVQSATNKGDILRWSVQTIFTNLCFQHSMKGNVSPQAKMVLRELFRSRFALKLKSERQASHDRIVFQFFFTYHLENECL